MIYHFPLYLNLLAFFQTPPHRSPGHTEELAHGGYIRAIFGPNCGYIAGNMRIFVIFL